MFSQQNLRKMSAYQLALAAKKYKAATYIATMEAIDGVLKNMAVDPLIKDQLWRELSERFSSLFSRINCDQYNCVADNDLHVVFEELIGFVKNKVKDSILDINGNLLISTIYRYSKIVPAKLDKPIIMGKITGETACGLYNIDLLPDGRTQVMLHSDKYSDKDIKIGEIVYFEKILKGRYASSILHFHN